MVFSKYFGGDVSTFKRQIRGLSKFKYLTLVSILIVGIIFVYMQSSTHKVDNRSRKAIHPRMHTMKYFDMEKERYIEPRGLLKELYPENERILYRPLSFDNNFRYPIDVDMIKLTEGILKGNESYIRPLNKYPFRYLKNPEDLCSTDSNNSIISLLILVKSSTQYYTLRHVIRKTWGRDLKKRGKYRMAFLLGYSDSDKKYVDLEHKENQDIIQEDFIDSYLNNTYKTVMAYSWASQHCSKARTVLFLDDDMYLNFDKLEKHISEFDNKRHKFLFSGRLAGRSKPIRNETSKWFMPWHEYPYDYYPKYLAGSAIFASMNVVKRFDAAFPYVRHFGVDDVYLGIVAHKLNITPSRALYVDNDNLRNFRKLPQLIANHGFRDHKLYHQTYLNLTSFRRRRFCRSHKIKT